jgi:hypothetical protein
MGILAASLLLQQIQGTSSPEKVVLKAEIKKRQSVGRVDGRKSRAAQRRNKAANIS